MTSPALHTFRQSFLRGSSFDRALIDSGLSGSTAAELRTLRCYWADWLNEAEELPVIPHVPFLQREASPLFAFLGAACVSVIILGLYVVVRMA